MPSQRYSLSEELTHIVCSQRHLPALLSVMAGTVCPLYHRCPCEHTRSLGLAGSGREFSAPLGRMQCGFLNQTHGLRIQGVDLSQIF